MPVKPLPPDPEPTSEDLLRFSSAERDEIEECFAEMSWRSDMEAKDKNAFHVPFATEVQDYNSYLFSPLWKRIRRQVLKSSDHECAACLAKATQVHHRDYRPRVLAGEDLELLVPLCKACHEKVHFKKSTWQEADEQLTAMVSAKESLNSN